MFILRYFRGTTTNRNFKVLTKSLAFGSIMCLCNDLLYSGRAPWFEAESETSEVFDSRNHDQRRQTCEPIQASKFVKHTSLTCKNLN